MRVNNVTRGNSISHKASLKGADFPRKKQLSEILNSHPFNKVQEIFNISTWEGKEDQDPFGVYYAARVNVENTKSCFNSSWIRGATERDRESFIIESILRFISIERYISREILDEACKKLKVGPMREISPTEEELNAMEKELNCYAEANGLHVPYMGAVPGMRQFIATKKFLEKVANILRKEYSKEELTSEEEEVVRRYFNGACC